MGNLKIGWARREYSIDEQVSLPGQMYMRISEGIMDPLYATALCIDGGAGNDAVIFCGCDLGNFSTDVVKDVLNLVKAERPDIPNNSIILNCTHAHTVPSTRPTPEKSPDGKIIYSWEKFRTFFIGQVKDAIIESWDNRTEGGFAYGYGYAVVAHSRRSTYNRDMSIIGDKVPVSPDGTSVMYGGTNKPEFMGYEAGADHFLNTVFTTDKSGKLTGMILNIPCPSQLSEHFTVQTADFWADIRASVAKEFGEGIFVLPQCAAAGDLSPRILHYKAAQCRRMGLKYGLEYEATAGFNNHNKVMGERYDIAERVLTSVKEIYSWAMKDIYFDAPVYLNKNIARVSARKVTKQERDWAAVNIEKLKNQIPQKDQSDPVEYRKAVTHYQSIKDRNSCIIEKYEEQEENPTLRSTIFTVRIGDIAFATNRYELYMDYMHRIQARSPFIQTFIVQLAGDEYGGYLATERGVMGKGYSASLFDNQVSAKGGQEIVEITLDELEKLNER